MIWSHDDFTILALLGPALATRPLDWFLETGQAASAAMDAFLCIGPFPIKVLRKKAIGVYLGVSSPARQRWHLGSIKLALKGLSGSTIHLCLFSQPWPLRNWTIVPRLCRFFLVKSLPLGNLQPWTKWEPKSGLPILVRVSVLPLD